MIKSNREQKVSPDIRRGRQKPLAALRRDRTMFCPYLSLARSLNSECSLFASLWLGALLLIGFTGQRRFRRRVRISLFIEKK